MISGFTEQLDGFCSDDLWGDIMASGRYEDDRCWTDRIDAFGRTICGLFRAGKFNAPETLPMQTGEHPDCCRWAL